MTDKELYKRVFQRFRASEETRTYVMNRIEEEKEPAESRKRLAAILVVAALIVAVPLTAFAAANTDLAGWFSNVWHAATGTQLSQGQVDTITEMTSQVGQSQTVNGTTVTVDSLVLGDNSVRLLLVVEAAGVDLDASLKYGFEAIDVSVTPEPSDGAPGVAGYGVESYTVDKTENKVNLVVNYNMTLPRDDDLNGKHIVLRLKNFGTGTHSEFKVLTSGEWDFDIPLQRAGEMKTLLLGDAEVMGYNVETDTQSAVELHDIRINATGISYEYDAQKVSYSFQITAVLKDGTRVAVSTGAGHISADMTTWNDSFQWLVPIDVDELKSILVYDTEIPIG